ncbi:MAG: SDR family oxidoreductase [Taibaiella sp.]|nr:SDR family oxidoreductase [Taibaiella sp.]
MGNYLVVGHSSGIGRALTLLLTEAGHKVHGISRGSLGPAAHAHIADVTTDPLPHIDDPLDGIAYCPGSITLKPFRGLKPADIQKDLDINVLGAVRVLQHYLPNLQKAESPSVVLFSTVAAGTGMPYHASVAIAKAAVEGLTKSLAAEWAPKIRVNCIAPSLTDTPLAARLLDTEEKRSAAAARHPLKVTGRTEDIAAAARLLLSDQSRFTTGQVWHIDGGISSVRI